MSDTSSSSSSKKRKKATVLTTKKIAANDAADEWDRFELSVKATERAPVTFEQALCSALRGEVLLVQLAVHTAAVKKMTQGKEWWGGSILKARFRVARASGDTTFEVSCHYSSDGGYHPSTYRFDATFLAPDEPHAALANDWKYAKFAHMTKELSTRIGLSPHLEYDSQVAVRVTKTLIIELILLGFRDVVHDERRQMEAAFERFVREENCCRY